MNVRGTHNLAGPDARLLLDAIALLRGHVESAGFQPYIPSALAYRELFAEQMGDNRMYEFRDRKGRDLVLIPEVTAVLREDWRAGLLKETPNLWYAQRCYRYDKPQFGRYREFWQFGIEILGRNSSVDIFGLLKECLTLLDVRDFEDDERVERGLGYYTAPGFEVRKGGLQLAGGGMYEEGYGWALGLERCLLVANLERKKEKPDV